MRSLTSWSGGRSRRYGGRGGERGGIGCIVFVFSCLFTFFKITLFLSCFDGVGGFLPLVRQQIQRDRSASVGTHILVNPCYGVCRLLSFPSVLVDLRYKLIYTRIRSCVTQRSSSSKRVSYAPRVSRLNLPIPILDRYHPRSGVYLMPDRRRPGDQNRIALVVGAGVRSS